MLAEAAESVGLDAASDAVEVAETAVLLAVSASMPSRRRRAAEDLANWLETEEGSRAPLADVARTLAKRNHGRSRAVVIAKNRAEAVTGLRAVAAGKPARAC